MLTQQSWSMSGQMLMSTWINLSLDSPEPGASPGAKSCSSMSKGHGMAKFAEDPWTMACLAERLRCTTASSSCGVLGAKSCSVAGNTTRLSRATRISMSP